MLGYLEDLTLRVARGIGELSEPTRRRHAQFLLSKQQADGGFPGREGGSDLYYTGFALRSLAVLGELQGSVAERAAEFLRARLGGRESIIDFFSLLYSAALLDASAAIHLFDSVNDDWRDGVAATIEQLRVDGGGYGKSPEGGAGSTYHTFLVLLCYQMIDHPLPKPQQAIDFLQSQRAEGGGFREIRVSKRAGTNPTAAAVAGLRMLDALNDKDRKETIAFLVEMQNDEGGLRANSRIPIADVLSTFTGWVTLADLEATGEIDISAAARYIKSLEQPTGGFLGAAWDTECDIEYTFYGLGCLALERGSVK